jgi:HK97 family phage major capsid protein/ATP-dependent Clp endopeptidase proteolytic subunit ClpP
MSNFKKYYNMIHNKGAKKAEILLYEQIGVGFWDEGIGAKQFATDLKALGDLDELDIRINSPGGSVFEGLTIYNLLVQHKAKKTVYIDGLAASIASVIAMAGRIVMPENATMMIHDPWSGAGGTAEQLRKEADVLDKIKVGIVSAYRNKTGKTDDEIGALMAAETWMNADEALDMGFCDECTKPQKMAAMAFDLSKFKNVPQQLAARSAADSHTAAPSGMGEKPAGSMPAGKQAAAASNIAAGPAPTAAGHTPRKETHAMNCTKHGTPMIGDACPTCDQESQTAAVLNQTRTNELARAKELRAIGKEFKMDALAEHAIENSWDESQLRAEILNRVKKASNGGPLNIKVTPAHEGKPFRSLGEQLIAVKSAASGDAHSRQMLKEVYDVATGAGEAIPSDGSFLIQTDFTTSLLDRANETSVLYPRCRHIPISGNTLNAPVVDETTRVTGSRWGGVQVYRTAEAGTVTAKKPKFRNMELKLEKLMGIGYATEELLSDASALQAVFSQAFVEELGYKQDDEILNGSGAGQMLGILNSGALVSVTKETGQLAATIDAQNIIKAYSRMPARSKANAVWIMNSECMPQLMNMQLVMGTAAVPLYMPAGGLSGAPYGTIFGKPVIEVEQCAALGTVGDIMFVDLSQYLVIEKGGITAARSVEVRFLYDEQVFKWTVRNNGQPIWNSPLTPAKGSATLSPFVAVATRA